MEIRKASALKPEIPDSRVKILIDLALSLGDGKGHLAVQKHTAVYRQCSNEN